jgi:flagellar basal body rod protein FlgB
LQFPCPLDSLTLMTKYLSIFLLTILLTQFSGCFDGHSNNQLKKKTLASNKVWCANCNTYHEQPSSNLANANTPNTRDYYESMRWNYNKNLPKSQQIGPAHPGAFGEQATARDYHESMSWNYNKSVPKSQQIGPAHPGAFGKQSTAQDYYESMRWNYNQSVPKSQQIGPAFPGSFW